MTDQRGYNKSNTTGATSEAKTADSSGAPELSLVHKDIRFSHFVVFCAVFCILLFVLLSILFWPLHCLAFDVRFLITPLVSSNCSFTNTAANRPQ